MISGIIAGGQAAARVPAHLVLLWPVTSPLLFSYLFVLSLCFDPAGVLRRRDCWGLTEERDGGGGCGGVGVGWGGSLKGIITVSPEYVHNHSVKQTGVGREESTFPSVFTSSWSSRLPGASTRSPSEKSRAADHSI